VGVNSVGQIRLGIVEEQDDSLNEVCWMIFREIDNSSVNCVTLRIYFLCPYVTWRSSSRGPLMFL